MNVQHRGAPRPPQLCHVSSSPSAPSSSCHVTLCSRVKCASPRHSTCVWLFPPATYNDSSPKKHPTLCFHIKKAPHKSAGASSNRHGTRNQSRRSRSPSHTEGAYRFDISKPQKFPRREAAPFPPLCTTYTNLLLPHEAGLLSRAAPVYMQCAPTARASYAMLGCLRFSFSNDASILTYLDLSRESK